MPGRFMKGIKRCAGKGWRKSEVDTLPAGRWRDGRINCALDVHLGKCYSLCSMLG